MSRAIESSFFDHNMIDANKILNTNVEGDHHTPLKNFETMDIPPEVPVPFPVIVT